MRQKPKLKTQSERMSLSDNDNLLINLVSTWGHLDERTKMQICLSIIFTLPEHTVLNLFSIN